MPKLNYLIQSTAYEQFATLGDWTISGGTGAISGGHLLLSATNGGTASATKTISTDMSMKGNTKLTIFIADSAALAALSSITIKIGSTTDLSKCFSFTNTVANLHEGSNELLIARNNAWTAVGGDLWTNTMIRLQVVVTAAGGLDCSIRFDDIQIGYYARPKVIFNFDDGYTPVYTIAYPYLRKYGFRGSTFVNNKYVEHLSTYMNAAQLQEIHDYGWSIGNHTATHPHLSQDDDPTVLAEIASTDAYLRAKGFTRNNEHLHFVYPYGDYDTAVVNDIASSGNYLTARNTLSNRTQVNNLDNQYLLNWQSIHANDTTFITNTVDKLIANGGVCMYGYHSLADPIVNSGIEIDTPTFQAHVDYVAQHMNSLDVITTPEWYKGLTSIRRQIL